MLQYTCYPWRTRISSYLGIVCLFRGPYQCFLKTYQELLGYSLAR